MAKTLCIDPRGNLKGDALKVAIQESQWYVNASLVSFAMLNQFHHSVKNNLSRYADDFRIHALRRPDLDGVRRGIAVGGLLNGEPGMVELHLLLAERFYVEAGLLLEQPIQHARAIQFLHRANAILAKTEQIVVGLRAGTHPDCPTPEPPSQATSWLSRLFRWYRPKPPAQRFRSPQVTIDPHGVIYELRCRIYGTAWRLISRKYSDDVVAESNALSDFFEGTTTTWTRVRAGERIAAHCWLQLRLLREMQEWGEGTAAFEQSMRLLEWIEANEEPESDSQRATRDLLAKARSFTADGDAGHGLMSALLQPCFKRWAGEPGIDTLALADRQPNPQELSDFGALCANPATTMQRLHRLVSRLSRILEATPNVAVIALRARCLDRLGLYDRSDPDWQDVERQAPGRYPDTIVAHCRAILAEEEEADADLCLSFLEPVLERDPNLPIARLVRGRALMKKGEPSHALLELDAAVAAMPHNLDAWQSRADARWRLGDRRGAVSDCSELIRATAERDRDQRDSMRDWKLLKDDAYRRAWFVRGLLQKELGDLHAACRDFDYLVDNAPGFAWARFHRGEVRRELGDRLGAIADFDAVISQTPDLYDAYIERGSMHLEDAEYARAIECSTSAINLKVDGLRAYLHRAEGFENCGKIDEAIRDCEKLVELYADKFHARCYLGRLLLRSERWGRLADLASGWISESPHASFFGFHGDAQRRLKQWESAVTDFDEAIARASSDSIEATQLAEWHYLRGLSRDNMKQFEPAIADYAEAMRIVAESSGHGDPQSHSRDCLEDHTYRNALYYRAWALADMERFDDAIRDFSVLIDADPQNGSALIRRGYANFNAGDVEAAAADFRSASQIEEHAREGFRALARLEFDRGDAGQAIKELEHCLARSEVDEVDVETMNWLAWVLCTCPQAQHRDGARAVEIAKRVCESSKWEIETYVDTLATAYAELGDFPMACQFVERALQLAPEDGRAELRARLDIFRSGQPYRE